MSDLELRTIERHEVFHDGLRGASESARGFVSDGSWRRL